MIHTEPQVEPTARYTPTKAAAVMGVTRRTIDRWTELGLAYVVNRFNGRKAYTGAALLKFWREYYL